MGRLRFDSDGKLVAVDGADVEYKEKKQVKYNFNSNSSDLDDSDSDESDYSGELRKSKDLIFLKNSEESNLLSYAKGSYWNLYSNGAELKPLIFSNGKSQEDIVKEVVSLINSGEKMIFLHGACGTGKSAIALNIARVLGKASIVVPVKALQRQYEEDYMGKKYLVKPNGEKMKIAMITGRDNHDSIIKPGFSCADPELPENIKITERNFDQLLKYYKENPFIRNKIDPEIKDMRRMSVAPANPYWSPILPADFEANQMKDVKKKKYLGCDGRDYIFYHRREGCSYYDQYLAYTLADAIIFNSAKYRAEVAIGRKPATDVEIIDEADDFLDSMFQQESLNLTRLGSALRMIFPESLRAKEIQDKILSLIDLEEQNKRALGIDEDQVFQIKETKLKEIIQLFLSNSDLESEIAIDELNYSNKALDLARHFKDSIDDIYLTYKKDGENLLVKLVSTNLSGKISDLIEKSKALVFMSGTLHSQNVLKEIFKISRFKIVEAETKSLGTLEIVRTGKEFDCKYSNFGKDKYTREDYLNVLNLCMKKSINPTLVHVNAFQDLPQEMEKMSFGLTDIMSSEQLIEIQKSDKTGKSISLFKQGLSDKLFTTKCSRGVDFPGDSCRSMVFTKYPNPNMNDTFWKVLQRTHSSHFWDFYRDKAKREFLQRIYRALRSKDDHVYVLSPDIRVLNAVRDLQLNGFS